MVEFGARLIFAGGLLFVAGATRVLDFDLAWKLATLIAATALLFQQLEKRTGRTTAVVVGASLADSLFVAIAIALSRSLDALGFIALVPCIFAGVRYGAKVAAWGPACAATLPIAEQIVHGGYRMPTAILTESIAVFILAIVFAMSFRTIDGDQPITQQGALVAGVDEELRLREELRRVRDAYGDLEVKTRKLQVLAGLAEGQGPSGRLQRMISRLADATGMSSLVLFCPAEFGSRLTVRAVAGTIASELQETSLHLDTRLSPAMTRQNVEIELRGHLGKTPFDTALLIHEGRMQGVVCIIHSDADELEIGRRAVEAAAAQLAATVVESLSKSQVDRRLREAELLYQMATLARGAESSLELASRFAREVREMLEADHVGIFLVEDDEAIALAHDGQDLRVVDKMSFAVGSGIAGWRGVGAPELMMFDVRSDDRMPLDVATRSRLSGFLLAPFECGEVFGYITVGSTKSGGLDLGAAETLRVVTGEFGRALARVETGPGEGVVTPRELYERASIEPGAMVVFDVLRKDQLDTKFGRHAMRAATRTFMRRVASRAPVGGAISQDEQGRLIVFLPNTEEAFATAWANEMAAVASMIGVRLPNVNTKVPFAVRARVAAFDPQNSRFLQEFAA